MSTMPSVGSGTYSPGPNMVCSSEQEKVGTGSREAIICPVYSNLRIRATVSNSATYVGGLGFGETARIDHSTVARNTSRFNAGGIVYNGTLILTNSTIADNSGDFG